MNILIMPQWFTQLELMKVDISICIEMISVKSYKIIIAMKYF